MIVNPSTVRPDASYSPPTCIKPRKLPAVVKGSRDKALHRANLQPYQVLQGLHVCSATHCRCPGRPTGLEGCRPRCGLAIITSRRPLHALQQRRGAALQGDRGGAATAPSCVAGNPATCARTLPQLLSHLCR